MRTTINLILTVLVLGLAGLHAYALAQLAGLVITLCVYGFVGGGFALNALFLWLDMRDIQRRAAKRLAAEDRAHLTLVR